MLSLTLLTGGREHILDQLKDDETWRRTRLKSAEGAASILVQIARRVGLDEASALILPEIQVWYKEYTTKNGPPPTTGYTDWHEGHDDELLNLFEPFTNVLSASWLNFATTDAKLWLPDEQERLANSFAAEVWKQLTWQRTDNQILAGVGIVSEDLSAYGHIDISEPVTPKPVEYTQMAVNAILNRIMLSFPDPKTLADNLDLVSDEDDVLAASAAERLGITMDDAMILREARKASSQAVQAWKNAIDAGESLDEGKTYVDLDPVPVDPPQGNGRMPPPPPPPAGSLKEKLQTSMATPPPPPPPPVATVTLGPAPPPSKGGRRKKNAPEPPAGTISVETLRSIKDHAGLKDEILAEMLGISRPTLANIMKGKGWCVPAEDRRTALMKTLITHVNALNEAYKAVGGFT